MTLFHRSHLRNKSKPRANDTRAITVNAFSFPSPAVSRSYQHRDIERSSDTKRIFIFFEMIGEKMVNFFLQLISIN